MRVTNRMITNTTLANIQKNKQNLTTLEEQYNSGKKIQRPSDDPIIAVRALRLRSNLKEINQYYERNIPDARSWMEITESALQQVTGLMTSIHTLCDQGAHDTLTAEDRQSISETLQQYKSQIYQEGNATYAGRYVFTGYKTDTSLAFLEAQSGPRYEITEELTFDDVLETERLSGTYSLEDYEEGGDSTFETAPETSTIHRIRLAYAKLDGAEQEPDPTLPTIVYYDEEGEEQTLDLSYMSAYGTGEDASLTPLSPDAYTPAEGQVNYIAETGELILSDEVYTALQNSSGIKVTYYKTDFEKGDLRPEHYFNCVSTPLDEEGAPVSDEDVEVDEGEEEGDGSITANVSPAGIITYLKEDQDIEYEVSFNQRLIVNTQGRDAINHTIGRELDEIMEAIANVDLAEGKIASVDKMIANTEDETELASLKQLKTQLELELIHRNSMMQKVFEESLDHITSYQDQTDIAIAELGSRYVRLDLTESRLSTQQDEFEDLMSNNEDADMVDTIVRFNAQEVIYNASLSAAAKVVQNTLMDFIR